MNKLEHLQRLSVEGKNQELVTAITQCSCKELRSFIGQLGISVRSKDYAIYNNKAGYADLLSQILTCKTEHKPLPTTKTRKTKNCNLRLVNVLFGEVLASVVDAMNAEPTQTALDSDQTAEKNPFWENAKAQFVSASAENARVVFQENCFAGFELGSPVHHSSEKLWKMWRELRAAYTSAAARFERSGDPDAEFLTFCRNRVDVYYLRCWLNVKPHLLVSVNGKLPGDGRSFVKSGDVGEEEISEKSRKRQSQRVLSVGESATRNDRQQRAQLVKSIQGASETLKTVRDAGLGEEVEEVVRGELAMYAKRLKNMQEETLTLC
ncbi:hypothetical protein PHYPSEUDO_014637 [Phytophthora pseudosyringae]|uniref:Uncharacterized protein n=1 Tax=Phytophthora pseudosyringae TaxID=221518 RepID=A0A8T1W0J4_9STRA|nr:hypothetical protein PHYPSEUDO_014637 [Phytophthora pseudosyringae]